MKYYWNSIMESLSDIETFEQAYQEATQFLIKKLDNKGIAPEDHDLIGRPPFGSGEEWKDKPLTKDDIQKYVERDGCCQFGFPVIDNCCNTFARITTMEFRDEEEKELISWMEESAQEEANLTGKPTTVVNCGGLGRFTAYPKGWLEPTHKLKKKFRWSSTDPSHLFRKSSIVNIEGHDVKFINKKSNKILEVVDGHSACLCRVNLKEFEGDFDSWFEELV